MSSLLVKSIYRSLTTSPLPTGYKVWVKAFQDATNLDGLVVIEVNGNINMNIGVGTQPKWVKHLRTWGESGTVKFMTGTTPKIADRGIPCMFVG
jgi:hypothetical protein